MDLVLEYTSSLLSFAMSKPLLIHQNLVCLVFPELQVEASPSVLLELFVLSVVWFVTLQYSMCREVAD